METPARPARIPSWFLDLPLTLLSGALAGTGVWAFFHRSSVFWLSTNSFPNRSRLLLFTLVLVGLGTALWTRLRTKTPRQGIWLSAVLLFCLSPAASAFPGLTFFLISLGAFAGFFAVSERSWSFVPSNAVWPTFHPRQEVFVLGGLTLASFAFLTLLSFYRHWNFETFAFDQGIFENIAWSIVHGLGFFSSMEPGDIHHSTHFSPYLTILSWVYRLHPAPETLLMAQAAVIAVTGIPIYFILRHRVNDGTACLWMTVAYWIHPGTVLGGVFEGLRDLTFISLPLAVFVFGMVRDRPFATFAGALGCLMIREDGGLFFAGAVVWYLWATLSDRSPERRRQRILLGALSAAGLLYFAWMKFLWMPQFNRGTVTNWHYYNQLRAAEIQSPFLSRLATIFTNPIYVLQEILTWKKLEYLWVLLSAWLVPSLQYLRSALGFALPFAYVFLSNTFSLWSVGYQFFYIWPPILIAAWADSIGRGKWTTAQIRSLSLLAVFSALAWLGLHVHRDPRPYWYGDSARIRRDAVYSLIRRIPGAASVVASESLVPHVAGRERVYTYRYAPALLPDYYLLWNHDWHRMDHSHYAIIRDARQYRVVAEHGGATLLEKLEPASPPRRQ